MQRVEDESLQIKSELLYTQFIISTKCYCQNIISVFDYQLTAVYIQIKTCYAIQCLYIKKESLVFFL